MSTSDFSPVLIQLANRYCDNALEPNELAQLQALLRQDEKSRQLFYSVAALHADLVWQRGPEHPLSLTREAPSTDGPAEAPTAQTSILKRPLSPILGFLNLTTAALNRPVVWSILGVAVVFYGTVALFSWNMRPESLPNRAEDGDAAVAMVSNGDNVRWSADMKRKADDSPIRPGESLKIDSGLIQLDLKSGATVIIEGPALWTIDGDNRATLHAGKLVAKVPKQAIGFTLDTPTAQIVDLGTEFGAEVNRSGTTEVAVLTGKVALHPAINRGGPSLQPIILSAGASRRIEISTTNDTPTIREITHAPGRFKWRPDSVARTNLFNSVCINRAATAWATSIDGRPVSAINDQLYSNQYDSGSDDKSAVAISFGSAKTFNRIELYLNPGWVIRGFEVQVAKPGLTWPDVNNNDHWGTISGGSFKSQAADGQDAFIFDQNLVSSGVRILATDKSNIADRKMRIREVMVFDRYRNIAPQATLSTGSDSWYEGMAAFNNELISNQTLIDCTTPRSIDFTWPTPQTIGSFMLVGGSGSHAEVLRDFMIEADLGNGLQTLVTHADNTSKVTNDILANAISTTHVRLTITKANGNGDTLAHVSEFYIFAPCEQGDSQKP